MFLQFYHWSSRLTLTRKLQPPHKLARQHSSKATRCRRSRTRELQCVGPRPCHRHPPKSQFRLQVRFLLRLQQSLWAQTRWTTAAVPSAAARSLAFDSGVERRKAMFELPASKAAAALRCSCWLLSAIAAVASRSFSSSSTALPMISAVAACSVGYRYRCGQLCQWRCPALVCFAHANQRILQPQDMQRTESPLRAYMCKPGTDRTPPPAPRVIF